MPGVILGAVVVILSLLQLALCPPINQPACAGQTVSALVFGPLGVAAIIVGMVVYFDQRPKAPGGERDTS